MPANEHVSICAMKCDVEVVTGDNLKIMHLIGHHKACSTAERMPMYRDLCFIIL